MKFIYPMTPEEFETVSDAVVEQLTEHVRQAFDYYVDNFPGITKRSGAQRLAFYRSTDQAYWDRLAATNPMWAKHNLMDWIALTRREQR